MVSLSLPASTMAFFTRYFKKTSLFLCLACVLSFAFAAESSIQIKHAELQPQDDYYSLNADVDINFNDALEEAVNKGVPLNFLIEFQIVSPRKYWFDDEIVTISHSVALSYHALSRQYLVNRGAHQKSFESLSEARQELAQIKDWRVLDKSLLEKGGNYKAALLFRLDQSKLPKAIQVDTISSEMWNLSSEKFEWSLKELNSKEPSSKELSGKELKQ
jgi:Domain of unknown function (DUF4390)